MSTDSFNLMLTRILLQTTSHDVGL